MAKVTFEFDDIEENGEILLTANRKNLAFMLYDISQYRRKLYKYENRENIPTQEIIDKLDNLLDTWYNLEDKVWN